MELLIKVCEHLSILYWIFGAGSFSSFVFNLLYGTVNCTVKLLGLSDDTVDHSR